MAHPNYFVEFDHYTGGSLAEFATALNNCPRKPVGTVQIAELCSMAEYPHGVYLFFDDQGKSWYVGKATSRSFVERVPSHFDQRQDTWFNTLPTLIMRVCKTSTYLAHLLAACHCIWYLLACETRRRRRGLSVCFAPT